MDNRYDRPTTEELEALPVLHQGQADDCHIDEDGLARVCPRCEGEWPCPEHLPPSNSYVRYVGGWEDTLENYADWPHEHTFDLRSMGRGMKGACTCGWHEVNHGSFIWADHKREMDELT